MKKHGLQQVSLLLSNPVYHHSTRQVAAVVQFHPEGLQLKGAKP
ncbi:MAG: hypothetical protein ABIK37_06170 [candidate division WOR-3 bacterium]